MENRFGVPCSRLKHRLDGDEVPCTNEAEAMAMAAGAWFAGKKPEVYIQNSGLGHIVDVVCSLYHAYNIPLPHLLVSVRHSPKHHEDMFKCTVDLIDIMRYDDVEYIIQEPND